MSLHEPEILTDLSHLKRENNHTISLLVANKPGVLLRVSLVFARRGYNVESLVVSPALDGKFSRMTISAQGDLQTLEQIIKQLSKLVDVVHATEHTGEESVERELALIKIKVKKDKRSDLMLIVDHFKAQTVDFKHGSVVIQVVGSTNKLDAMLDMLSEFNIVECVRTGKVLMARGGDQT